MFDKVVTILIFVCGVPSGSKNMDTDADRSKLGIICIVSEQNAFIMVAFATIYHCVQIYLHLVLYNPLFLAT